MDTFFKIKSFIAFAIAFVVGLAFVAVFPAGEVYAAGRSEDTQSVASSGTVSTEGSQSAANSKNSHNPQEASLYTYQNTSDGYALFTNYVDGYSIKVPQGMSVDMSYSNVRAALEKDSLKIEIYKQATANIGRNSYITYSNKFTANTIDHVVEYNGNDKIAGTSVHLLSWHRDKLSRVEGDRNYYLTIDIPKGSYVYTIFMKADRPIGELGGYEYLVTSFQNTAATKQAYCRKSAAPDAATRGWNETTRDWYNKYFSASAELSWGIFETNFGSRYYVTENAFEDYFDYEFPVVLVYTDFKDGTPARIAGLLADREQDGKVIELTLQTGAAKDGGNMIYDLLDGDYDTFLKEYAGAVSASDVPVLFRFANEMNGDWCPYSAYNYSKDTDLYIAAYRYIYEIFAEAGADNVIWVWNPNCASFPNYKWNHSLMYYPGDQYVDVVGMTAYNTGNYYAASGERWKSFTELYDELYRDYCTWFSQNFMITEFSCAEAGGDKAAWITDMGAKIKSYDRIKIAVWWHGCDLDASGNVARSYFIDDSPAAAEALRKVISPWRVSSLG